MKPNRGSLWLIWLLPLLLCAEDFTWHIHANNEAPYQKEAVLLNVDLNQTNPAPVLLFQFQVNPSPDYRIHQIYARHDDTLHHTVHHNLYEIYPLRTGDINVTFSLIKRVTNDEKVRYFASGDRDDFKKLDTDDYPVALPPLTLHVKPLPQGTQLVGDFNLSFTLGSTHVKAYEPIAFKVTITGDGYPPVLKQIISPNKAFTLFSEKPIVSIRHSQRGTHNRIIYPMALSATHSFILPRTELKAFNPKTAHRYVLTIPPQHITVDPVPIDTLVDKVDTPKPLQPDWGWVSTLLGYLIAFAAGFATAWLLRFTRKQTITHREDPIAAKIKACSGKKALLTLLMAHDAERFASVIAKLESDLYGDTSHTLTSLKQEAKELLS